MKFPLLFRHSNEQPLKKANSRTDKLEVKTTEDPMPFEQDEKLSQDDIENSYKPITTRP